MNSVLHAALTIFGISILVIVHEGGHYLVARACGMRVVRYSIGFGPAIFRYKPKDSPTTFQVCAIPLLAYVQIAGMNPHEDVDPKDPALFPNKGLFARMATIAAGPVANYVAASLLLFGLAVTAGLPDRTPTEPMVIAEVVYKSPALRAGLRPGDVVVEANGQPVRTVTDLVEATRPRAGQPTTYVIMRDGVRLDPITMTPYSSSGRGMIGVQSADRIFYRQRGIGEAARDAVVEPFMMTLASVAALVEKIRAPSTEGLMGPPQMFELGTRQMEQGLVPAILFFVMLSVALGFFNLLPFPALDGGRLMFLAYELITRRRPNERFEAVVHTVGLVLLLSLVIYVSFTGRVG